MYSMPGSNQSHPWFLILSAEYSYIDWRHDFEWTRGRIGRRYIIENANLKFVGIAPEELSTMRAT